MRESVTGGTAGDLCDHLFQRTDGSQIFFVYDKAAYPTVQVQLTQHGSEAFRYNMDGSFTPYADFDGTNLRHGALRAENVSIFRIVP